MAFKSYRLASGNSSIADSLTKYGERAKNELGRQLFLEATGIVEASKGLVPIDTGTLRASSYVQPPEVRDQMIVVEFGYGGPAAKVNPKTGESSEGYALFVHENLEAFHKVGMAKFLEVPFMQAQSGMAERIARNISAKLTSGEMG